MIWRSAVGRFRGLIALGVLVSLTTSVPAADTGVTTSYGFAAFGSLKYPAGFKNFDYVNPDAPKGGVFRSGTPGYYDSFNIVSVMGFPPLGLEQLVFDKLMVRSLDEPASQYGLLAETISYPKDLSWVEYRLRADAKFSDGKPVTPEDVIFSVHVAQTSGRPLMRRTGTPVKAVFKTGPRSVRMVLIRKNSPTTLAAVGELTVLPEHFYRHTDFTKATMQIPVGSGPYRIKSFVPGRSVYFERRADYWGKDRPTARGRYNMDIRYDWYRDTSVYTEAFLAGDYDFRSDMSALRWDREATLPAFKRGDLIRAYIRYKTPISYQGIVLNTRNPFFQDRRVRQAMLHAFDYEWFQRNILHGYHGRVSNYFENSDFDIKGPPTPGERKLLDPWRDKLPADVFAAPRPLPVLGDRTRQRANLLEAARLIKAAGYPIENMRLVDTKTRKPIQLDLMLGYGVAQEKYITQFLRNLDRLGIKVDIKLYDNSTVRQFTARYDYDLRISVPNIPALISPGSEMRNEWASDGRTRIDSRNLAGVADPVVDDMLDKLIAAQDRESVVNAMRALNRVLVAGTYTIPMQHVYPAPTGVQPFTYWNKFGRPRIDPTNNFPLFTLDTWWIDKDKQAALRKRLGKDI
ncbi:extracellular solute-binding protein [Sphingobium nicotianae]|uniref:Extracellular solute-binding protein n=1 Tax=Sphingobium nicotianae TaxID=2782607 RepID=A0A9X1DE63_9SPHN|nr:extracellular solute-binding protein [Sphingobium nicotianae]MBT2188239.1 extracellular solute-binding protein [Sphingobium nicotianae]